MAINFDLISDLYLTSLKEINWDHKATSLYCVIAGNITKDHDLLERFLIYMSGFYEAVFFIDGDLEHTEFNGNFAKSYMSLKDIFNRINNKNIIYLHENIIILDEITLVATNGWTTFDFTGHYSFSENVEFLNSSGNMPEDVSGRIYKMSMGDQRYLSNSIKQCQSMGEIENIAIITNSIPRPEFIMHNHDYNGTILGDLSGNPNITECLNYDEKHKVIAWLFGRYRGYIEYMIDDIHYSNNTCNYRTLSTFYPKQITL